MDLYGTAFTVSFLLIVALLIKLKGHGRRGGARLPPGPWKLPIIGSLHHLLGPAPHRALAALAKRHGPVMHLQLGEVSTLVVSSPEAAAEFMKTHDVAFADRPMTLATRIVGYNGQGLSFAPYGAHWREMRKMSVIELLSAKRVRSFRSVREEETHHLVRSLCSSADVAGQVVNVTRNLLQLTNDISARVIIGGKCRVQKEFIRIMTVGLQAAGGFNLADLFPSSILVNLLTGAVHKMQRLYRELDEILSSIVEEHRQRRIDNECDEDSEVEEDLVDVLLKVQNDGSLSSPLTDDSVKATVLDLFVAGSETSATTLEWIMSELMRNPAVMDRVQREVRETLGGKEVVTEEDIAGMSYLKLVVKEALRLHSPVPLLLPRENRETEEVFGYRLPAKTRVLVNAWAMARDPRLWEDAEEFKPERFEESAVDFKGNNFEFIPFGAGRRMCPGMAFGLANVELPLACLLYYFDWEFPDDPKMQQLDMDEIFMLTSRRRQDLCLRAIPRIRCPNV